MNKSNIFSILIQIWFIIIQFNGSNVRSQDMRILHHTLRMNQHFISASVKVQMTSEKLSTIFLFFESFILSPAYIKLVRYIRDIIRDSKC